jgi:hypothetical protein
VPALDLVQAREPVHVRHADVEQDQVWFRAPDEGENLRSRLRLADDLEVVIGLERAFDAVQDEPVVVGDQDPHRATVAQPDNDARPGSKSPAICGRPIWCYLLPVGGGRGPPVGGTGWSWLPVLFHERGIAHNPVGGYSLEWGVEEPGPRCLSLEGERRRS